MGLDISVYRTKNLQKFQEIDEAEREAEDLGEKVWNAVSNDAKYNDMSEEDRDMAHEASNQAKLEYAKENGYDIEDKGYLCLDNDQYEEVEDKSKKYPEHDLFTLGYFRSSYNDSGINSVMRTKIGMDLYDVFPQTDEDYYVYPDWEESLIHINTAIELYKKSMKDIGNVRVMEIGYNEFSGPLDKCKIRTKEDAMNVYQEQVKRKDTPESWYTGKDGTFALDDPIKVKAVITGVKKRYFNDEYLPTSYLVYEQQEGTDDHYLQSLEIVKESIEMAIADSEHTYFLGWSG